MTAFSVAIIIKEVYTSNVFTYAMENDMDIELFMNWLTVKIRGDFRIHDFELVNANYRLYNSDYTGDSELAPAISFQDLYNMFVNQRPNEDIALYIRPQRPQNEPESPETDAIYQNVNVNVNQNLPIYYPPITEQQRTSAVHRYGIDVNAENRYSNNRNNILWEHPLRTGTLYGDGCETCVNPYPSRNYFGCRHIFCENCIDTIQNNNHQNCAYCGGFRI